MNCSPLPESRDFVTPSPILERNPLEVQLELVKQVVDRTFPIESSEKTKCAFFLHGFLNEFLQKVSVGGKREVRLVENSSDFPFPFPLWIEAGEFDVHLKIPQKIGIGSCKDVWLLKNTAVFSTPTSTPSPVPSLSPISPAFRVVSLVRQEHNEKVLSGLAAQQKLLDCEDASKYFVPLAITHFEEENLELEDSWFPGILGNVLASKEFPSEQEGEEPTPLSFLDFIGFYKNIALGVKFLGERGFFYRDLKLDNVFLDRDESGKVRARIGDFDLMSQENINITEGSTCAYWNAEARMGYASKETDVFSLGLLMTELVPDLRKIDLLNFEGIDLRAVSVADPESDLYNLKCILWNQVAVLDSLKGNFLEEIRDQVSEELLESLGCFFFESLDKESNRLTLLEKATEEEKAILEKAFALREKIDLKADLMNLKFDLSKGARGIDVQRFVLKNELQVVGEIRKNFLDDVEDKISDKMFSYLRAFFMRVKFPPSDQALAEMNTPLGQEVLRKAFILREVFKLLMQSLKASREGEKRIDKQTPEDGIDSIPLLAEICENSLLDNNYPKIDEIIQILEKAEESTEELLNF